jgi:D-alanyl-D-alanine carboxypeptidase/D-alanyl-D-alanine-endopeptidase (penicillin-binding protein 4)
MIKSPSWLIIKKSLFDHKEKDLISWKNIYSLKFRIIPVLIFLLVLILFFPGNSFSASKEILRKQLENIVKSEPVFNEVKFGIYVKLLKDVYPVFDYNGNAPLVPASNLKVVTTACALERLGSKFRYETSLWGIIPIKDRNELNSNLYIKGSGDPTFSYSFMDDPLKPFKDLADGLKRKGVNKINGDVVCDDWAFDRYFTAKGWKENYIFESYAAPCGALSVNNNLVTVFNNGGSLKVYPPNSYAKFKKLNDGNEVWLEKEKGDDFIKVHGSNGLSSVYGVGITIYNPSMFSLGVFMNILKQKGITVTGKSRLYSIAMDEGYQKKTVKLAQYNSCELSKIVKIINKESDNICAQHLFKSLGYFIKGRGTTLNSYDAVNEFFCSSGIDPIGLVMDDGSGLSEKNKIKPKQLVAVLDHMYTKSKNKKVFWESLPFGGDTGSTLEYRLSGVPVRAKTGTLKGFVSLSGYVKTKKGQMLVFSFIFNNSQYSGDYIRGIEDKLVNTMAQFNQVL